MASIGTAVLDFIANTAQFDKKVTKIQRSLKGMQRQFRGLNIIAGGFLAGATLRNIVRAGVAVEGFESTLRAATGSALQAGREMDFVRGEVDRLGLSLQPTIEAYTKLTAAARGTVLEGRNTRDIFTAVVEASRVMNLSVDATSGVIRALEQIMSKGTVQAEELRGQLGERLPGAFQLAARAMGTTTEGLGDMLKKGEVLAEDLLPKLAVELRRSVGPEVAAASQNAAAQFNRFQTAIFDLQVAIAEGGLLDVLSTLAQNLASANREAKGFFRFLSESLDLTGRSTAVAELNERIAELEDRLRPFRAALKINPTDAGAAARVRELIAAIEALKKQQLEFIDAPKIEPLAEIDLASLPARINIPVSANAAGLEEIKIAIEKIDRTPLDDLAVSAEQAKERFIALSEKGIEGLRQVEALQEAREIMLGLANDTELTAEQIQHLVEAQRTYSEAVQETLDELEKQKQKSEEIAKAFGEQALRNTQDALAGFIASAKDGFKGLDDIAKRFLGTLIEIIAQAAAAKLLSAFATGGGGGGFFSTLFGLQFGGNIPGSSVGGGTDSQVVAFRKSPTESVSVTRPGQGGGASVTVINQNDFRGLQAESVARILAHQEAVAERTKAELMELFRQGAIPV